MHLDTHVVLWLHESGPDRFPAAARQLLDAEDLAVSPMVVLELHLLHEIGRVQPPPDLILGELGRALGLVTSSTPFPAVVSTAARILWTRDPFDRLICAQAVAENQILLTKDRRIRTHLPSARWDDALLR